MIFGNINSIEEFPFLEEEIKECFEYAKTHDLASFEKGSHEIDGDRLFVNIVEYTTTNAEDRFWEAHKNYFCFFSGTRNNSLNLCRCHILRFVYDQICFHDGSSSDKGQSLCLDDSSVKNFLYFIIQFLLI